MHSLLISSPHFLSSTIYQIQRNFQKWLQSSLFLQNFFPLWAVINQSITTEILIVGMLFPYNTHKNIHKAWIDFASISHSGNYMNALFSKEKKNDINVIMIRNQTVMLLLQATVMKTLVSYQPNNFYHWLISWKLLLKKLLNFYKRNWLIYKRVFSIHLSTVNTVNKDYVF